jgi:hypothetical protein
MTKTQIATREQSIEEIFVNELDMIYYPGYAQEISESDPERFDWELTIFKSQFQTLRVKA